MLEVKVHYEGPIAIFTLDGRFDAYGATLFDKEAAAVGDKTNHWIIDFNGVNYLSSTGIRSILQAEKSLRARHGAVVLVGLTSYLVQVLEMCGLKKALRTADSLAEALRLIEIGLPLPLHSSQYQIEGRDYQLRWVPDAVSFLDLWGSFREIIDKGIISENVMGVGLDPLNMAFGIGGFGMTRAQAAEAIGEFIAFGNFAGVVPADGHCRADFILTEAPADTIIFTSSAIGISGSPKVLIEIKSRTTFTVAQLIKDFFDLASETLDAPPPLLGLLILAEIERPAYSCYENFDDISSDCRTSLNNGPGRNYALIIGVAAHEPSVKSCPDKAVGSFIVELAPYPLDEGLFFHGHGATLNGSVNVDMSVDPTEDLITLISLDNLEGAAHIEPETEVAGGRIWLYLPETVRTGEEKLLKIEVAGETEFLDEWEIIARRIYSSAQRIELAPIHGGYVSKTFHVASYDNEGRRLLPTVMKIGAVELNKREEEAYQKYVLRFILNNSTTIMGTASYGDWAGLSYNFVGIAGPESTLTWLKEHYLRRPVEDLLPLFDAIFTDILRPWYGQPTWEPIYPYSEHDPTLTFFESIFDDVQRELGISSDNEVLHCSELGTTLPNPYYFLKYRYPERRGWSRLWYKSVTHGDLNMQNILLDERENIYIIDFSETRLRNVVSDFARLEAIVKFEMTRLNDENDLKELIEFDLGLLEALSLDEIPPFNYEGSDPMVEKAYKVILRLRRYADKVTLFETDMVPYLLALLEWTYPVVSYGDANRLQKRFSALSAGLICRKIEELEIS
ncbi:MAG: STAS domain-containing protein [Deltaproteobacteria bacterium]|nr:MAG: STAS domain-containing protein [Deltaproteobacteria bacterium]